MKANPNLSLLTQIFSQNYTAVLFLFLFVNPVPDLSVQNNEDAKKTLHFSGNILATNNGISLIPSFNLGDRPLLLIFLSAEKS